MMVDLEPRIIRRVFHVVLVLMAEIIFYKGIAPCTGHRLPTRLNSSTQTGTYDFLDPYFYNKSRRLEEVIYSDVLHNIRALIRSEAARARGEGRKKATGAPQRGNNTNSQPSSFTSHASNVFFSIADDIVKEEGRGYEFQNYTLTERETLNDHEYLLGYSGNPFGSPKSVPGFLPMDAVGVSEKESSDTGVADPRRKRSVLHLYNMVLCATGCNPLSYKGYGCYCGFLGSGFVVDGIDSCCKLHDWCYNNAGCPTFLEYFIPYLWKCYHHQPLCAINHGYYGGSDSCAQRLCECDRRLALCLRKYPCPNTKALCTSSPWRLLQNILML